MAWPVLTIGVMPTVNGARLGAPTITAMSIERLEITYASRSRGRYHWAHLRPPGANASLRAGRYFVSEAEYTRWSAEHLHRPGPRPN